ncbi:glycoside hydrolase family 2 TIM barrel-domain containing protein [Ruoffia sp. FAM 24228]|uniref:glycoside hydrolase family 2 TIM barrel-domain containing protein n=1 Tax=Ruoffia sp. FAM 24228 TaxID=3259517 RepID=UPI003883A932
MTEASGSEGKLTVNDPTLWKVLDSYLYRFVIKVQDSDAIIDEYEQAIGIRTVEIQGEKILINGEETYLKGYGKHEDADIIGRGFSYPMNKRDFELMKWSGANSFRTSHYPYAEEVYQMADREGFLIIDEVAAVGFLESIVNFLAASQGTDIDFFEAHPNLDELQKNHIEDIHDRFYVIKITQVSLHGAY